MNKQKIMKWALPALLMSAMTFEIMPGSVQYYTKNSAMAPEGTWTFFAPPVEGMAGSCLTLAGVVTFVAMVLALVAACFKKANLYKTVGWCCLGGGALSAMPYIQPVADAVVQPNVAVMLILLVCWLLGTWIPVLNVTVVAIIGMAVLFMPGIDILEWKPACQKVNWDLCFTMGAVGVFISALTSTGIMDWLVQNLFSGLNSWNIYVMFFVIGLVVCVIRAFIPTAPAIAALFGAPLLAAAAMTGASPVALLAIPAFWACAPMLLWIEPIFLFSYGYNYYKPLDVLKYGSVPCLILIALMSFLPNYVALFGF
jgi:di/tricarboxylate transporter